jgi:DNA transposition AAA+ family ATPase
MTQPASTNVTQMRMPHIAPLRNVLLLRKVTEQLMHRTANLPGIGVFYGKAGLGKSQACAAAAAAYRAIYIEVRSWYTKKSFLEAILAEMGIEPERTTARMAEQICGQLMRSPQLVILDEGDRLVQRGLFELVRDIYEGSKTPILLVGEERFPANLGRVSERFYDRVLAWQPAERADMEDARKLARLYSPDVEIKDDLVGALLKASRGVARKISVNIANARLEAQKAGKRVIDLATWGDRPFFTGDAPVRRPE